MVYGGEGGSQIDEVRKEIDMWCRHYVVCSSVLNMQRCCSHLLLLLQQPSIYTYIYIPCTCTRCFSRHLQFPAIVGLAVAALCKIATMSAAAALERISPELEALLKKYRDNNEVGTAWKSFVNIIEKERDLHWTMVCPSINVGAWSGNRGGLGFNVCQAINTGVQHVLSGYQYKKASDGAWAIFCDQADNSVHQNANTQWSTTQGLDQLRQLLLLSFGSTHCNVFLRCVSSKLPCTNPKIAPSGQLDESYLSQFSDDFKLAMDKGLDWKILHPLILTRFPRIIDLGMRALNTKGTAEMSEMEGLLTISTSYNAIKAAQPELPDDEAWERARVDAVIAEPFWIGWSRKVAALAKSVTLEQIKEASAMKSICVKTPSGVGSTYGFCGGEFLAAIADGTFHGTLNTYPRIKMAVFMANVYSPVEKIKDGRYALLSSSMVTALKNKKAAEKVQQASLYMDQARDMLQESLPMEVADSVKRHTLLFHLECKLIYHICQVEMQSRFAKKSVSLQAIFEDFKNELSGKKPEVDTHAKEDGDKKPSAPAPAHSIASLSSATIQAHKLGIKVGSHFYKKTVGKDVIYKATEVNESTVKLTPVGLHVGKLPVAVDLFTFKSSWQEFTGQMQKQLKFEDLLPKKSQQWEIHLKKSALLLAVGSLYEQYETLQRADVCEIWCHPTMVRVKKEFKVGQLVLVPATTSIMAYQLDSSENKRSHPKTDLGIILHNHVCSLKSMPINDDSKFVAPYWGVGHAPDDNNNAANVKLTSEKVDGFQFPACSQTV